MRLAKNAWVVAYCVLSACQVVSGIAPLDVDDRGTIVNPVKVDASTAGSHAGKGGNGGTAGDMPDAGPKDAGHDSGMDVGPPCERPEGSDCNWETECGCMETEHCQARGADAKWTCVKRGKKQLGETCRSPDECEEGTCDQRVCRKYCTDICDDGRCLPATVEGDKLSKDVKVCWKGCQAGTDSCPSGTTCQTHEVEGQKASFCLPPANPCPSTEDGKCDEPVMCATGTDSVDCSCNKPEGAECNHVDQCGCATGKSCKLSTGTYEPICGPAGSLKAGELCEDLLSCGPGLVCVGGDYGSCRTYCAENSDCPNPNADTCQQVTNSKGEDIEGFKVCRTGCSESVPCPANNSCTKLESGSFCLPFEPEIAGGECNLSYQRGCDRMPNTACVLDGPVSAVTSRCLPHAGQRPIGSLCESDASCQAGSLCFLGVCRRFCHLLDGRMSTDEVPGCGGGDSECIAPTLNDDSIAPFNLCIESCVSDSDCQAGQQCLATSLVRSERMCIEPLTTECPVENGRCDEPMPRGNGLCAPGYDTVDCMGTP